MKWRTVGTLHIFCQYIKMLLRGMSVWLSFYIRSSREMDMPKDQPAALTAPDPERDEEDLPLICHRRARSLPAEPVARSTSSKMAKVVC